jgi:predicted negative regulator of RcsB-dependent stress response
MATHLDLDEQEQIDQLKAFWKQYGNLITWTVTIALLAYAGWQGWNYWQRDQGAKAAAMFDALDAAANSGDTEKTARVFADMKERYPRTAFTQQAALLTAKVQQEKGQAEAARGSLTWAADNASEKEYRTVARLRLAGLLLDEKKYDEALKQLDAADTPEFAGLVADRRGDILLAQGKKSEAKDAYNAAYKALGETVQYRVIVEAKLASLGAAPEAVASGAGK